VLRTELYLRPTSCKILLRNSRQLNIQRQQLNGVGGTGNPKESERASGRFKLLDFRSAFWAHAKYFRHRIVTWRKCSVVFPRSPSLRRRSFRSWLEWWCRRPPARVIQRSTTCLRGLWCPRSCSRAPWRGRDPSPNSRLQIQVTKQNCRPNIWHSFNSALQNRCCFLFRTDFVDAPERNFAKL